jgi:hypothetical protein
MANPFRGSDSTNGSLRFWNGKRRFGLAANWLDADEMFAISARLNGSESGGGQPCPAGFFVSS